MNAIADIMQKCRCVTPTAKELKIIKKRENHSSWAFITGAIVFGLAGVWIVVNGGFVGIFYIILAIILAYLFSLKSEPADYTAFYGIVIKKETRYNEAYSRFTPQYHNYDDTYAEKSEKFRYWAEYYFVTAEVDGVEICGIQCSEKEHRRIAEGDSIIIVVNRNEMQIKAYKK